MPKMGHQFFTEKISFCDTTSSEHQCAIVTPHYTQDGVHIRHWHEYWRHFVAVFSLGDNAAEWEHIYLLIWYTVNDSCYTHD